MSNRIFASYGRSDTSDLIKKVVADIKKASFEVWLDQDYIDKGGNFDVFIEKAIDECYLFLACMSPYSLREESICRDEVVYAHNQGKTIIPIKLFTDINPTLLLCRKNWIDFSISYKDGITKLVKYLKGDKSVLSNPSLSKINGLTPIDFASEISRLLNQFEGRKWFAKVIKQWSEESSKSLFLLLGDPGIGKSSIMSWMSQEFEKQVIGIHFCMDRNARTLDPYNFVLSICAQFSSQNTEFLKLVNDRVPEIKRTNASEAFHDLLLEPLRLIPQPKKPYLILIDAIDESIKQKGETILSMLSEHMLDIPGNIRFIVTSRNSDQVCQLLKTNTQVFRFDSSNQDNLGDAKHYIRKRLKEIPNQNQSDNSDLEKQIALLGAGNFLFLKAMIDSIEAGDITLKNINKISPGMDGYYTHIFKNLENYHKQYQPLFKLLCIAKGPMSFSFIKTYLKLDSEKLHLLLLRIKPLLKINIKDENQSYSLFHQSLGDWLGDQESSGEFWCDEESALEKLIPYLLNNWKNEVYALRYLHLYLIDTKNWKQLGQLLSDICYLEKAWEHNEWDIKYAIMTLEKEANLCLNTLYTSLIHNPDKASIAQIKILALVLQDSSYLQESLELQEYLSLQFESKKDQNNLARSIYQQGMLRYQLDDLGLAKALFQKATDICKEINDLFGLASCLNSMGTIYQKEEKLEQALECYKQAEIKNTELNNQAGMAASLNNQANVLRSLHSYIEALEKTERSSELCLQINNQIGLAISLSNKGQILEEQKKYAEAYDVFMEAVHINKRIGNKASLVNCLLHQSDILMALKRPEEALKALETAEEANQRINILKYKCKIFINQFKVLSKLKRLNEASLLKAKVLVEANKDPKMKLHPLWKEMESFILTK